MRQYRPLRKIRVLAFEVVAALPSATRMLTDLGADVVRVVPPHTGRGQLVGRLDNVLGNKSSIAIDLRRPQGCELARRLAVRADIVCSNYRPRVMPAFGLDYESLRAVKPEIIVLQLTGYGTPGPWQEFPAYGPSVEAAGGMNALTGDAGEQPVKVGSDVFADYVSGRYAVLALIAALQHRHRTGAGQYIDLSMYESMVHLLGEAVIAASRDGQAPPRRGNRDAVFAPQGIYLCQGADEWLALSVATDEQWRALVDLIDDPSLQELELDHVEARRREHDRIDRAIAGWSRQLSKEAAAAMLQARGVPAGPVQKASDIPLDPQYAHRGFFQQVRHTRPIFGYTAHPHMLLPWRTDGYPRPPLAEPHAEGSDDAAVLRRWLGMPRKQAERMLQQGVTAHPAPVLESQAVLTGPGGPIDADFACRLGLPSEPVVAEPATSPAHQERQR